MLPAQPCKSSPYILIQVGKTKRRATSGTFELLREDHGLGDSAYKLVEPAIWPIVIVFSFLLLFFFIRVFMRSSSSPNWPTCSGHCCRPLRHLPISQRSFGIYCLQLGEKRLVELYRSLLKIRGPPFCPTLAPLHLQFHSNR